MSIPAARVHAAKADEQKRAQARAKYEVGSKLYNLRDYEKALEEFRGVYLLTGEPSLLFNIGQCERQLGRPEDARKSFKAYLREGKPTAQQTEDVERMIVGLEATIKENAEKARQPEPVPVVQAAPQIAEPAPVAVVDVQQPSEQITAKPKSRKWVWGVVAASVVVAVGLGVGLGVGLTRGSRYPSPSEGAIDGN